MTPKKPILSFDIDGVLADFTKRFIGILNKNYGTSHSKEWPEYNCFGEGKLLSQEHWDKTWEEVDNIPDFWETLDPLESANLPYLSFLLNKGFIHAYFVTKRHTSTSTDTTTQTVNWLRKQGLGNYTGVVAGAFNRIDLLRQLNVDAHLDDWGDQFLNLSDSGINCYLMDASHNRYIDAGRKRVYSVEEFVEKSLTEIRKRS